MNNSKTITLRILHVASPQLIVVNFIFLKDLFHDETKYKIEKPYVSDGFSCSPNGDITEPILG
jgi:hypothetical protein